MGIRTAKNSEKIERVRRRLEKYQKAEEKILLGQSYSIGSRTLTKANLKDVQDMIKELEGQLEALERTGTTARKVGRFVPMG